MFPLWGRFGGAPQHSVRRMLLRRALPSVTLGIVGGFLMAVASGPGGQIRAAASNTDPGCTPSSGSPGIQTVCLKEVHEGFTALTFDDHSCDNVASRDSSFDYFVFVLPAAGDPGRG